MQSGYFRNKSYTFCTRWSPSYRFCLRFNYYDGCSDRRVAYPLWVIRLISCFSSSSAWRCLQLQVLGEQGQLGRCGGISHSWESLAHNTQVRLCNSHVPCQNSGIFLLLLRFVLSIHAALFVFTFWSRSLGHGIKLTLALQDGPQNSHCDLGWWCSCTRSK